jgi:MoaA/NifB/PqqE/SkfB family radical SAM enzyme
MKISLITCPAWSLWDSHPDLRLLQSVLREHSCSTNLFDLNIDMFKHCSPREKELWADKNMDFWENMFSVDTLFKDKTPFIQQKISEIAESGSELAIFSTGRTSRFGTELFTKALKSQMPETQILLIDTDNSVSTFLSKEVIPEYIDAVRSRETAHSILDIVMTIKNQGTIPAELAWEEKDTTDNNSENSCISDNHSTAFNRNKSMYSEYKEKTILSYIDFMEGTSFPVNPLEVFIELSNVCNLKCAMCPTFSGLSKHRHLAIKSEDRGFFELKESLESISEVLKGALNIHCFGYGESTIHPDFKEIVRFLSRYDVMLDFFTNGMNLDDEICNLLVKNRVATVTISFSGSTKEEYENIYLGGNFEQVLSGIKRLSDTRKAHNSSYPNIEINSLAFEHHVSKLPEFIKLMAEHGANTIQLKSLQLHETIPELAGHRAVMKSWGKDAGVIERAKSKASEMGITFLADQFENNKAHSEIEWKEMKRESCTGKMREDSTVIPISELKGIAKKTIPYNDRSGDISPKRNKLTCMNAHPDLIEEILPVEENNVSATMFPCMEPFKTMYIRKNNSVKPCCFSPDNALSMGNLKDNNLKEIWNGQGYSFLRNTIINDNVSKMHCETCIKNDFGPKFHNIPGLLLQYLAWYDEKYSFPLIENLSERLLHASNHEIVLKHKNTKKHFDLKPEEPAYQTKLQQENVHEQLLLLINYSLDSGSTLPSLLQYNFDPLHEQQVGAWIWSPKFQDCRLDLEILIDEKKVAELKADRFRNDLLEAGIGDGSYSILYTLPDSVNDGRTHTITCKVLGTDLVLGTKTYQV